MIHYHGTPCGGTRAGTVEFLACRHALVPYPRQDDLPVAAEVCQSFIFDSGAFSAWTRGEPLDVEGYTRWCDLWHRHPGFDWALIPDVIDGSESDNDALLRGWPDDIEGVPVWHLHESLDRLCRLGDGYRTVALGSSGRWATPGTAELSVSHLMRRLTVLRSTCRTVLTASPRQLLSVSAPSMFAMMTGGRGADCTG